MYSLDIPVPLYLKKYLDIKYSQEYRVFSRKSFIGMLIFESLTSKNKYYYDPVKVEHEYSFSVFLSDNHVNRCRNFITHKKVKWLNKLFDELFMEELMLFVKINLNENTFVKALIRDFLKNYEIGEDDIALESLYQRCKRRMNFDFKSLKAS